MDMALLMQYLWVLLILIALEGILATDNALVMAMMVKHLPEKQRRKALFYGLAGAFVFRVGSLFAISFLVDVWQVQAIGAVYLIFLSLHHLFRKFVIHTEKNKKDMKPNEGSGFWMTVFKVELADIAFAVDSILAAVALALTLPNTNLPMIGGIDGGKFLIIFAGGFIGLILIRFAANYFVHLLHRKPGLETAAYLVVGWVGVKLALYTLSHPHLAILPEHFVETTAWKITFWGVLLLIFLGGWFLTKEQEVEPLADKKEIKVVEEELEEGKTNFSKKEKAK